MSAFYYPMTVYVGANAGVVTNVTTVNDVLPGTGNNGDLIILASLNSGVVQGLYAWTFSWNLVMPQAALSASAIFGHTMNVYFQPPAQIENATGVLVYTQGVLQPDQSPILAGSVTWLTATPPALVSSIIQNQGDLIAGDSQGLPTVLNAGSGIGQVLTLVDTSATPTGLAWMNPAGAPQVYCSPIGNTFQAYSGATDVIITSSMHVTLPDAGWYWCTFSLTMLFNGPLVPNYPNPDPGKLFQAYLQTVTAGVIGPITQYPLENTGYGSGPNAGHISMSGSAMFHVTAADTIQLAIYNASGNYDPVNVGNVVITVLPCNPVLLQLF